MPGNLAELRPLIFIAAFVGFTFLLVGLMISETPTFFSGVYGGSATTSDKAPNPLGIIAWNDTLEIRLGINPEEYFKFSGHNVALIMSYPAGEWRAYTYENWWIFYWNVEDLEWYSLDNTKKSVYTFAVGQTMWPSILDREYETNGLSGLQFNLKNSKASIPIILSFNGTLRSSPSDAYNHDDLWLILNADWTERMSGMNALTFISALFSFSLPGMPFVVNAIIWLMIFPALAYLTFIFVLKIIGAVLGGG